MWFWGHLLSISLIHALSLLFPVSTDYLPPKIDETGVGSVIPKTCIEVFWDTVVKHGDRPAMALKRKIAGKISEDWEIMTWNDYWAAARTFAKALHSLKVNKFEIVNILGFNSPEWFIANMGTIMGGGIAAGTLSVNTLSLSLSTCQHNL